MLGIDKDVIRGVSPVVGTVLMVAIVVVLAGAAMMFFTDVGDNLGGYEPAAVDVAATTDGAFVVDVTTMGESEELIAKCGSEEVKITDVGKTRVSDSSCDQFVIVGVSSEGEQRTINMTAPDEMEVVEGPPPEYNEAPDTAAEFNKMDGSGASDDPYIITNVYELQAVTENLSAHYKLGNDIDARGTSSWNTDSTAKGFSPIGSSSNTFSGTLDGNGKEVSNLHINRSDEYDVGLFSYVGSDGTITNIGLSDSSITGNSDVGGLVANNEGLVSNSSITGSVDGDSAGGLVSTNRGTVETSYSTATVTGDGSGGLVSKNESGATVTKSYSTGNVTSGYGDAGGLVRNNSGEISESYTTSDVESSDNSGGIAGSNSGTITDTYATGSASGGSGGGSGGIVGENYDSVSTSYAAVDTESGVVGDNSGTVSNSYWDAEGTGIKWSNGGFGLVSAEVDNPKYFIGFNFDTTWTIEDGQPELRTFADDASSTHEILNCDEMDTETNADGDTVHLIKDSSDLKCMNDNLSGNYKLANDIDMSSVDSFVPIGTSGTEFSGTFNGDGNEITGLSLNRPHYYVGLFGSTTENSSISNVRLKTETITGYRHVGSLVAESAGSVSNVSSSGNVSGRDAGGLVSTNTGTVENSSSTVTVTGRTTGGLVSKNESGATVTKSYSTGDVTSTFWEAGGLVGNNSGEISKSYTTGDVDGDGEGGGIAGSNSGTITDTYATGSAYGTANGDGGGLVGNNYGTVSTSYSVADSSFGLIGSNDGEVSDSYWSKTQSASQSYGGTGLAEDNENGYMIGGSADLHPDFYDSFNTSNWEFVTDPADYPKLAWQVSG